MGFTDLKNKIASKFNSSSTLGQHGSPEITVGGSKKPSAPSQEQSYTTVSASAEATTPSNTYNASDSNEVSAKEQKLMDRLHMSEEEQQKQAEERRKYVREYLRNNRDANAYNMGAVPKIF